MQLVARFILILMFGSAFAYSQTDTAGDAGKRPIEADFLLSYYSQDGDHAAVTGGTGTESLTDVAQMIIVNVPMGEANSLTVTSGVDFYSSASSQNVDPVKSGASGSDVRGYLKLDYEIASPDSRTSYGFFIGGSVEYDYTSASFGANWLAASRDQNRQFGVSASAFFDRISLIYPIELRNGTRWLDANQRQTYSLSLSYIQVLSRRAQASISADLVYQKGLLSTPFHRTYFQGEQLPRVENLPDSRLKLPVSARLNYYVSDFLVTRMFYRYYSDDFGIKANTYNLETALKLSRSFTVTPFYRYHDQSAADYFQPFGAHLPGAEFYTSDYDLSAFSSRKMGVGLRYFPALGIQTWDSGLLGRQVTIRRLDLRAAVYDRSDGLNSLMISLGLSLSFY